MQDTPHIAIVGSGLVGMTIAASLLQRAEFYITILDRQSPEIAIDHQDARPISLSATTVLLLKHIGVWPMLSEHAAQIVMVHVSEQHCLGSLLLSAADAGLDALGYVVPYGLLQRALFQAVNRHARCHFKLIDNIEKIEERETVSLSFNTSSGAQTLQADYLIAADGVHSRCRDLLNISAKTIEHNDIAISAILEVVIAHQHVAYERFTESGILALLPMWQSHQYRMVLTGDADLLATFDDQKLQALVDQSLGSRIGIVKHIERAGTYPLKTVLADKQVTQRCVLVGDSAHRIYPIAAQGYNLAVRDVAMLVDYLAQRRSLMDYVQAREPDQIFTTRFTQRLEWIFGLQVPLLDHIRATSLLMIDLMPPLKRRLIQQMLGRYQTQPSLLCVE